MRSQASSATVPCSLSPVLSPQGSHCGDRCRVSWVTADAQRCLPTPFNFILPWVKRCFCLVEKTENRKSSGFAPVIGYLLVCFAVSIQAVAQPRLQCFHPKAGLRQASLLRRVCLLWPPRLSPLWVSCGFFASLISPTHQKPCEHPAVAAAPLDRKL